MRALGASERVMDIISSAELPSPIPINGAAGTAANVHNPTHNLEIAGGATLGERVAGRVMFKVRAGRGMGGGRSR